MTSWLSCTSISHHDLLPHIPSICFSAVNTSPCPGIPPHFLNASSQPLPLPGDQHSCLGYVWLQLWDCLMPIPLRLPQISCFTLSLKYFSSDLDNCPNVGDRTPASVPPPAKGRSSPTNTPVSPPSSFILLRFMWFCAFFSAGQIPLCALNWCSACTPKMF